MKHRTTLAVAVVAMCLGPALAAGPTYAGTDATTTTSFAFKASGLRAVVNLAEATLHVRRPT